MLLYKSPIQCGVNKNNETDMDIHIRFNPSNQHIEVLQGHEELEMELSMGLAVECLDTNTNKIMLLEIVEGKMHAQFADCIA